VRLHADRVDALFRTPAGGQVAQPLEHAFILEIDRDRAGRLGHAEPLGQAIDRDHLFRAEQDRAADRELADRPRAPDRDRVGGLDVALHGALPAGRENVAQEQHLLVGQARGHFDVRRIRERHAQIFGLPARIAAGQVSVAEQARGGVAEHLVRQLLVAVGALAHRVILPPALVAFAAENGEGHDDAVTHL
jgi:hypothetical protein